MSQSAEQPASLDPHEADVAKPRRSIFRRLMRGLGIGLLALVVLGMLFWATLAVNFADTHAGPRTFRAILFVLASVASVLLIRPRRYGLAVFALLFVIVLGWFFSIEASNDRDWTAEGSRTPWAQIEGDQVTVHNVRNFDYHTETDFTPAWEDRHYDLSKIRTVDLMLVHWGSPDIAHIMVSFGFADGQYLCVSIETRKEKPESYSALKGFFRQYELIYVFADERDAVRLRTNYRPNEDVYVFRTRMTPAQARGAFLSYLETANKLEKNPEFYNALTSNCATNVLAHAREGEMQAKFTKDILLSGHAARQAYSNGRLDTRVPFEELRSRGHINAAARAADQNPDFSRLIRVGVPDPTNLP